MTTFNASEQRTWKFKHYFSKYDCLSLGKNKCIEGFYYKDDRWRIIWKDRTLNPIKYIINNNAIPSSIGFFGAILDAQNINNKKSTNEPIINRLIDKVTIVKLQDKNFNEMHLASCFALLGLCTIKVKANKTYIETTDKKVNRDTINDLEKLLSSTPDHLSYKFLLADIKLPDFFIKEVFIPYFRKHYFNETLNNKNVHVNDESYEMYQAKIDALIFNAMNAAQITIKTTKLTQFQIIKFKYHLRKSVQNDLLNQKQIIQSDLTAENITYKLVNTDLYLDNVDRAYCDDMANLRIDSFRQKIIQSLLGLKSWADRNKRVMLSKGIDFTLGAMLSSLFITGVGGFLYLGAAFSFLFFWFAVESAILSIKQAIYKKKIAKIQKNENVNDTRDVKDWTKSSLLLKVIRELDKQINLNDDNKVSDKLLQIKKLLDGSICDIKLALDKLNDLIKESDPNGYNYKSFSVLKQQLEHLDAEDVNKALDELKTLIKIESFKAGYSGFTQMYKALECLKPIQQEVLNLKHNADYSMEDAIRYQLAYSMFNAKNEEFTESGEHVEKFLLNTLQAFTLVKTQFSNSFDHLWEAFEGCTEGELRTLFLKAVDGIAGNRDPLFRKVKHLIFHPPALKLVASKRLKLCKQDREELLRELAAGMTLRDMLASAEEKEGMLVKDKQSKEKFATTKLWELFKYSRDTEFKDIKEVAEPSTQVTAKVKAKYGTKRVSSIMVLYVNAYFKRVPFRVSEMLLNTAFGNSASAEVATLSSSAGAITTQVLPIPTGGFGIGIVAWGVMVFGNYLANRHNNRRNAKRAEKRHDYTQRHSFHFCHDSKSEMSAAICKNELKALRRQGKHSTKYINNTMQSFISLKYELDKLLKKIQGSEMTQELRQEAAILFLSYRILKLNIRNELEYSSGLSYSEMIRYRSLMKARVTRVYHPGKSFSSCV